MVGVAEQGQIEPAAAARASRDGPEFIAELAKLLACLIVGFSWKRALTHAGNIRLGDSYDSPDGGGSDSGSGDSAPGCGGGGGHEWVGSMIDVEHRSLGAFKHYAFAVADGLVEQRAGVCDERSDLLGGAGIFLIHLRRVERLRAEKRLGNGVLFVAGILDMGLQKIVVQQIDDPQAIASGFVLIVRADAAAGSADLLPSRRALSSQLNHAMVGEDDLRSIGNEELAVYVHAQIAELAYFAKKRHRVQHHSVADHRLAIGPENAAGHKLQNEFLPADDDSVPGVVPASVTRHHLEALGEHVHDFPLAFIAPLGADHHCCLCSHESLLDC